VLAEQLGQLTGISCRGTNLGHIQRGGSPTPIDRVLGTNFGFHAIELLMKGRINQLVVWKDGKLNSVPLSRIAGKTKTVKKNDPLVKAAKAVGTSFGV
jgi:6-phosphofructokinase 1